MMSMKESPKRSAILSNASRPLSELLRSLCLVSRSCNRSPHLKSESLFRPCALGGSEWHVREQWLTTPRPGSQSVLNYFPNFILPLVSPCPLSDNQPPH